MERDFRKRQKIGAKAITLLESCKESDHKNQESLLELLMKIKKHFIKIESQALRCRKKYVYRKIGMQFVKDGKNVAVLALTPQVQFQEAQFLVIKLEWKSFQIMIMLMYVRAQIKPTQAVYHFKESILVLENASFDIILLKQLGRTI